MKYKPGTFSITPNKEFMRGKPTELQSIHFWLCERSDSEGLCFPSRPKIAEDAGIKSLRTVDKYIDMLVEMGILVKTKRRKKGEAKNKSNLYQIMVHDMHPDENNVHEMTNQRATDDTYQGATNGTVTIPSINNTQLTINTDTNVSDPIQDIKSSLGKANDTPKPSVAGQLPDRFGSTPAIRFLEAYKMYYRYFFDVEYKEVKRIETLSKIKRFLSDKTEQQGLALLNLYFNWGGIGSSENNKLKAMFFPLGIFFYHENNYVTTFRKECDLYNYDKPERIKAYLDFYAKDILKRT